MFLFSRRRTSTCCWVLLLVLVWICCSFGVVFFVAADADDKNNEAAADSAASSSSSSSPPEEELFAEDAAQEEALERMQALADKAMEALNAEHATLGDQWSNYEVALKHLGSATIVFEELNCGNTCDPRIVNNVLASVAQAAEVLLELVEKFYDNDQTDAKTVSLIQAKAYIDRGFRIIQLYDIGKEAESYFGSLVFRHKELRKQMGHSEL